jgi:hypothetical protein
MGPIALPTLAAVVPTVLLAEPTSTRALAGSGRAAAMGTTGKGRGAAGAIGATEAIGEAIEGGLALGAGTSPATFVAVVSS